MASPMAVDEEPSSVPRMQVNLSTRDPAFALALPSIRVPTNLKRYGLSTLINHLLDTPSPIPFDFLVNGAYLRTSLDEYLTQAGLSSEQPLDVEYVRSQLPPKYIGSFEQDDWISSIHLSSVAGVGMLTGSFNGSAQITNLSGEVLAKTLPFHTQAVKTVRWVDPTQGSFLTAGLDRAVNLWSYSSSDPSSTATANPTATFVGHKSTITSLSYNPTTSQFLSASADHTINLWSTDTSLLSTAPPATTFTSFSRIHKKRKLKTPNMPRYAPLSTFSSHTAPVSQLIHSSTDPTVAYSVSLDHSIITHDLVTAQTVDTKSTQHPLLSIASLDSLNLLAIGSAARHILLHDPRASTGAVGVGILRGHTNAVVDMARSPESEFVFASGGHDGVVRVWDVRSVSSSGAAGVSEKEDGEKGVGSLFVIKRESGGGKVFGVDWSREVGLVGVGEDRKIQVNRGEGLGDVTVVDQI